MKITRILVYEGSEHFINISLGKRSVCGIKQGEHSTDTIKEFYITSPIPLSQEPPDLFTEKEETKEAVHFYIDPTHLLCGKVIDKMMRTTINIKDVTCFYCSAKILDLGRA